MSRDIPVRFGPWLETLSQQLAVERKFDVIILGGGPNGLTAGAYMARAGQKVLIVEKRHEMGGGLATEEVTGTSGLYANTHAVYMMMVDYAPPYRDLDLENGYGLKHIYPALQFAMPLSDGRCLCLYTDIERTCRSLAQFSKEDADTYREIYHRYGQYMDEFLAPATYVQPVPPIEQVAALENSATGRELNALTEKTPREVIEGLFRNDHVRAMMLQVACMWGLDPEQSGVSYLVPLYINRSTNYRLCRGGSHMLTQALIKVVLENRGRLLTDAWVKRIRVEAGTATGVEMEDGRVFDASKAVISTLDQHQTFLRLVGKEKLDSEFVEVVNSWMWEHWSLLGVHLALKEAPRFAAARTDPDIDRAFVYLLGRETPEAFLEEYRAVGRGELPAGAGFTCCFPTVHDPLQTRRPGMHTGNITRMAPYDLKGGRDRWYSLPFKREAAASSIATLRKYAPNMTDDKVHSFYVSTPLDIENKFSNMVKGSIKVGQYHPLQMGYLRPNEQCSSHRSPVKNLYMGGASTHPGGTVILGAGYLAANAVAEDKGIQKWWREPEMVTRVRQQGLLP